MHLPSEIIVQILQDVSKADLKAARLVNKQWSLCAAEFLFDTLHISPHKPNIDVFQSVTQHPVLRNYVTMLAYDGVGFSTKWTYSQYFHSLWYRVTCRHHWAETRDSSDAHINSFTEIARSFDPYTEAGHIRIEEAKRGEFDFIKAGYSRWQDHALYEQRCIDKNDFMRILTIGLQKLDRLSTVQLKGSRWQHASNPSRNADSDDHYIGSPLARSWGLFDAPPLYWIGLPIASARFGLYSPGNRALWTIIVALSKVEKPIHDIALNACIPDAAFDTRSKFIKNLLLSGVGAFTRLKTLKICIDIHRSRDGTHADRCKRLGGLRMLLDRIRDLEVFELRLPFITTREWFTYNFVFPEGGAWPHLKTFAVSKIAIGDTELIHLLFARMPCLQHLRITEIHIPDKTWESVIEALKFRRLSSLELRADRGFDALDTVDFLPLDLGDSAEGFEFSEEDYFGSTERYVVHGMQDLTLRHPGLEDSQPTQDSLDYLRGIFDRANEISHIMDIDVPNLKEHVAKVCAEANAERDTAGNAEGRCPSDIHCQMPTAYLTLTEPVQIPHKR